MRSLLVVPGLVLVIAGVAGAADPDWKMVEQALDEFRPADHQALPTSATAPRRASPDTSAPIVHTQACTIGGAGWKAAPREIPFHGWRALLASFP